MNVVNAPLIGASSGFARRVDPVAGGGQEEEPQPDPPMTITTVGLDADDTLWHNETVFRLTQARFLDLLTDHDNEAIQARLAEIERRNLRL